MVRYSICFALILLGFTAKAQTMDFRQAVLDKLDNFNFSVSDLEGLLRDSLYFHNVYPDSATLAGAETATDGFWAFAGNSLFIANGSAWVRQGAGGGGGGGAVAIDDLTDVTETAVANSHAIIRNPSNTLWINGQITSDNVSPNTLGQDK